MSQQLYVKKNHPLSRFYSFPRKLTYETSLGRLTVPSVEHAFWVAMLVQHGQRSLAKELLADDRFTYEASNLPSWIREKGFKMNADWLVNAKRVYEDMIFSLVDQPKPNEYVSTFRYHLSEYDLAKVEFVVCTGNNESIYSCGNKENAIRAIFRDGGVPEYFGGHVWARVLDRVVDILQGKEVFYNFEPGVRLLERPVKLASSHPRSVFVLSDSLLRYLKAVELGRFKVVSGATLGTLLDYVNQSNIDLTQYHYVVIHAGVNDCSNLDQDQQRDNAEKLQSLLTSVSTGVSHPTILVSPTFPYFRDPKLLGTITYPNWLLWKLGDMGPSVKIVQWDSPHGRSPFFSADGSRVEGMFDDDRHISRRGTVMLWKTWAEYIPELSVVPYELWPQGQPYGNPAPPEVPSQSTPAVAAVVPAHPATSQPYIQPWLPFANPLPSSASVASGAGPVFAEVASTSVFGAGMVRRPNPPGQRKRKITFLD